VSFFFFFFFQAEDGIRDGHVTGVQTCALPICEPPTVDNAKGLLVSRFFDPKRYDLASVGRYKINKKLHIKNRLFNQRLAETLVRSEERRVGKECRCWRVKEQ